mmetsp:Transcript_28152/g.80941  ORF Transcript_28152/g.80941 Transcript_28152/m.80941 type:complete len:83 (+) Transcript_28152:885-1133(+)
MELERGIPWASQRRYQIPGSVNIESRIRAALERGLEVGECSRLLIWQRCSACDSTAVRQVAACARSGFDTKASAQARPGEGR